MGPSGAGKTTFLNALMGTVKYGTISGQVWVNGRGMKMSRLRRIMGFVPQVRQSPPQHFVCVLLGLKICVTSSILSQIAFKLLQDLNVSGLIDLWPSTCAKAVCQVKVSGECQVA